MYPFCIIHFNYFVQLNSVHSSENIAWHMVVIGYLFIEPVNNLLDSKYVGLKILNQS